jgi:hypothetical protein
MFGSKRAIEEPLYDLALREYGRVLSGKELSEMAGIAIDKFPPK